LLILDDLHWADESMLALLNYLANRLARHAVIIGTYRNEYSEHRALARTIEELIKLGGSSAEALRSPEIRLRSCWNK
jgi:predicted ATPase